MAGQISVISIVFVLRSHQDRVDSTSSEIADAVSALLRVIKLGLVSNLNF